MKFITVLLVAAVLPCCFGNLEDTNCRNERNASHPAYIISPGHPRNYPFNTICTYKISSHSPIILSFKLFSLEDSKNCTRDRVEIIDGPISLRYCGKDTPPVYRSRRNTNFVTIRFVSNSDIASTGFLLEYHNEEDERACYTHLTAANGTIISPGYPAKYPKNLNCLTRITVTPGKRVYLAFSKFHVQSDNALYFFGHCIKARLEVNDASYYPSRCFCGTILPPVVISRSNELTLKFHSHNEDALSGYLATYKEVDENFCDVHLTSSNGTVTSPSGGYYYENNRNCTTTITVAPEKRVSLIINYIDLADGNTCSDYVQIIDGSSSKKLCGYSSRQPILISETNQLTIKFTSDFSETRTGFLAIYKEVDPSSQTCNQNHTAPNGTILNFRYPAGSYIFECTTTITAQVHQNVRLRFKAFEVAGRCIRDSASDYLQITDGDVSKKFCGSRIPITYESKTSKLVVRYKKFYSERSSRLWITYESMRHYERSCDAILTAANGTITSPNYPAKYENNLNCSTKITVAAGKRILLNFTAFSLEIDSYCPYDYVEIIDGSSSVKYCGHPSAITSKTNELTIRFKTDSSVVRTGFSATYSAIDGVCDTHLTAATGVIRSPGYPTQYPNNLNCTTKITVASGKRIHLNFTAFSLESHPSCTFDYVEITNGSSSVKYCGNTLPPSVTTKTNELTIKFKTDGSVVRTGFSATYTTIVRVCDAHLTAATGVIISPGYPAQYSNNLDCTTKITVASGKRINLNFIAFDLESHSSCAYDYVEITNGSSSVKYCGNTLPPSVTTKTNELTIKFKTDGSVVRTGFSATYTTVDDERNCDANLTATNGTITSPNYPAKYENNLNCTTIITVAPGKRIHLNFTAFSLQSHSSCAYDQVKIIDGSSSMKYCGNYFPPSFTTKTNQLTIKFKTDSSRVYGGFSATYHKVGCDAILTASNGVITSPGYPAQYQNNLYCTTRIRVAAGKRIHLYFTEFSIESHSSCSYDYVEILNGSSSVKYCGNTLPPSVTTKTNELTIKFKTDGSLVQPGFSATYTTIDTTPPQRPTTVNDRDCGKRSASQARIIGGVNATEGAWPWQIGIFSKSNELNCGGSLINSLWVVTAAHCVRNTLASDIVVRVGELDLNKDDGTEQQIDVEKNILHREYDRRTKYYDIALLKLKRPAMMNNYVNTVCVPGENETIPVGSTCFMTGWGKTKYNGSHPPHLQQASMKVLDSKVCQKKVEEFYNSTYTITDIMICAGEPGTLKHGCHGDSGGPLVCLDSSTNKFVLHGVVNWGSWRCNAADVYEVFARVQSSRRWIDRIMREN